MGNCRWSLGDSRYAAAFAPPGVGVQILVDTQGWRFGDERTQRIQKYSRLEHRPDAPLSLDAVDDYVEFIHADFEWQLKLGAGALLMPSLMP